jgi:hypothetical protein
MSSTKTRVPTSTGKSGAGDDPSLLSRLPSIDEERDQGDAEAGRGGSAPAHTGRQPRHQLLILTIHDEEEYLGPLLHAGASGYGLMNVDITITMCSFPFSHFVTSRQMVFLELVGYSGKFRYVTDTPIVERTWCWSEDLLKLEKVAPTDFLIP